MRTWLAFLALIAIVVGGVRAPAMAVPAMAAVTAVTADTAAAAGDCHGSGAVSAAVADTERAEVPADPDCCPEGCVGQCTMVAVVAPPLADRVVWQVRLVHAARTMATAPDRAPSTSERPPKTFA